MPCNGFMIATTVSHLRLEAAPPKGRWGVRRNAFMTGRRNRNCGIALPELLDAPLKRPSNEFMAGLVKSKTFAYYIDLNALLLASNFHAINANFVPFSYINTLLALDFFL